MAARPGGRSATTWWSPPRGRRPCSATPGSRFTPRTSATATSSAGPCGCRWSGEAIPIVADDYADPAKGTGAVKITPAHDFNDWAVGQRHALPAINVMDTRARIVLKDNARVLGGRPTRRGAHRLRRARPLRGARAGGHARGGGRLARRDRRGGPHRAARRPLEGRDRAVPDRPVVRRRGEARRPGAAGGADGRTRILPERAGEDLLPLAREHRALVHLAPALVGAPDPGVVRRGGPSLLRDDRGGGARAGRGEGAHPRSRRARHLVLVRHLADRYARVAGGHARAAALLPDERARHGLRHPLLLGRPDDDDAARADRRGAVPRRLHPRRSSATRRARRCRSRSATSSTRSS